MFLKGIDSILVSKFGPVITGLTVGVLAPVLVMLGNPGNMGICVACFERDIAGRSVFIALLSFSTSGRRLSV